jgi:hypothetical protein
VLRELREEFEKKGYYLVPEGLSGMGGFYQRAKFASQVEHRLLAKNFPEDSWTFPFTIKNDGSGPVRYIESDLASHSHRWFNLQLIEVVPGRQCDPEKVRTYLQEHSQFPHLAPTGT